MQNKVNPSDFLKSEDVVPAKVLDLTKCWRLAAIAAVAFFGGAFINAQESTDFLSPDAFVQSLNKFKVSQSAKGDLNGDGLEDWIGAVAPASGEDAEMHKIVVLLQKSKGHYELAGSSNRFFWSDSGSDVVDLEMEIKKGTFYVRFNSYSRSCAEDERFQFRLEGSQWRMIGATYRQVNPTNPNLTRWYVKDANLITGDEILAVQGTVKQRAKFSPLLLDLRGFPFESKKIFRTSVKSVCN